MNRWGALFIGDIVSWIVFAGLWIVYSEDLLASTILALAFFAVFCVSCFAFTALLKRTGEREGWYWIAGIYFLFWWIPTAAWNLGLSLIPPLVGVLVYFLTPRGLEIDYGSLQQTSGRNTDWPGDADSGISETEKVQEVKVSTIDDLLSISPAQFENTVARLFRMMGFQNVEAVGRPGDEVVDIKMEKTDDLNHLIKYAVQCKRFGPDNHVGAKDMQIFCAMFSGFHNADRGVYVTTSRFTREAADIAHKFRVTLIDGSTLADYLTKYMDTPSPNSLGRETGPP